MAGTETDYEYQVGDVVSLKNNRLIPYWIIKARSGEKFIVTPVDNPKKTRLVSKHNMYLMEKGAKS